MKLNFKKINLQGTRILWDIEKPTEAKTSTQIVSFSSKNGHKDSILPLMTTRHENATTQTTSSLLVLRTQSIFKRRMNKKKLLGQAFTILIAFLFFLNSHFLIFLQIKENLNLSQVKATEDSYHNETASPSSFSPSIENKSNFSNENIYDHVECAPELGTWYSKFMDNAWFWVDIFVYFFIPFITMCITFSVIKTRLKTINRNYACICLDKRFNNHIKNIYLRKIKRNNNIIYVLFGTNLYFCISIVPFFIFSIFKEANFNLSVKESYYLKSIVDVLFYSNNALSIVFYGFTSKDFRRTLKRMLGLECCFAKKKKSTGNSVSRRNKWSLLCKKNI